MHPILQLTLAGVGGGGYELNLENHTLSDFVISPITATVGLTFNSNGSITYVGNTSPPSPDPNEWITEQGSFTEGASYEVAYTTLTSGDAPTSGASLGTYVGLSVNRTWTLTTPSTVKTGAWIFRVRKIALPSTFVEATMTVTCESVTI